MFSSRTTPRARATTTTTTPIGPFGTAATVTPATAAPMRTVQAMSRPE